MPQVWELHRDGVRNFHLEGYSPRDLGMEVPQWGPGAKTPVEGLEDFASKLKHFADIMYRCCKTIRVWKFCTTHFLILDQYVHCGATRHLWVAPSPYLATAPLPTPHRQPPHSEIPGSSLVLCGIVVCMLHSLMSQKAALVSAI